MKKIIIILTLILLNGCMQTTPDLSNNTNKLFDQKHWQPINNNSIEKEI